MIQALDLLHNTTNRGRYIFAARPASCSLDGHLLWVRRKHFFDAEAARSIFSIIQGKAAEGRGDGWDGSLPPSQVIARLLKVRARRNKLRISDSERWTSDSEHRNGVSANAVCAEPGTTARLALSDRFSQTSRSDRSVDTSSIDLRSLPLFICA